MTVNAFCAQGIEKKLKKFPATAEVVVNPGHRLVAVSLKDGEDIPDADLRKALTDAGLHREVPLPFRNIDCGCA
jgi:copper chaperone CopZ